jgi:hypothetical protein
MLIAVECHVYWAAKYDFLSTLPELSDASEHNENLDLLNIDILMDFIHFHQHMLFRLMFVDFYEVSF